MNATARQLYPASRTDGMTRHETILTAQRTIDDVTAAQNRRAAARFTASLDR